MEIVRRVQTMKEISRRERDGGLKIGFVPTMGYLHEGHLSLVRHIRKVADTVVVSVFINPAQFGPNEDLETYPRDLARDTDLCIAEGVDYLFTPDVEEMYPADHCTFVEVTGLSAGMEGKSRLTHFRGVSTVVLKLFEIVRPHVAAFGQKDAQQAIIIKRMVRDLMLDVEIVVLPIVRDEDQIALSSRNKHLSEDERRAACAIPRALDVAKSLIAEGKGEPEEILAAARRVLEAEPLLKVDYVELVDIEGLQPVTAVEGEMLLAVAVYAGETRLIDNMVVRT